jgi:hypothetical protein
MCWELSKLKVTGRLGHQACRALILPFGFSPRRSLSVRIYITVRRVAELDLQYSEPVGTALNICVFGLRNASFQVQRGSGCLHVATSCTFEAIPQSFKAPDD